MAVSHRKVTGNRFRYLYSLRFWLATFVTLLLSVTLMASMSLWLPPGAAGINHLVIPLVIFPLIWAACFFYAVLETHVIRALCVMLSLLLLNGGLVVASVMGALS